MTIKELLNRALFYISVPKCVLCNEILDYEDRGLCKRCREKYSEHIQRNCPKCARILKECSCSYDVLDSHGIKSLIKLFRYSKSEESMPSNYLIYSLKQDNRGDVVSFLADELAEAIRFSIDISKGEFVITNVPRRKGAIVNFGFDHAELLARNIAKRLELEYVMVLKSNSKKSQKSVYGHERMENARFGYRSKKSISLKGKSVILIDDILTTGSSMINCAKLLRELGTRRIICACLGTAYKEPYIDYFHSAIN